MPLGFYVGCPRPTVSSACSPVGFGRPDSPPFRSDHPHPCAALLPAIPQWRRPGTSFTDLPSHRALLGWSPIPVGIIPFRWSYYSTRLRVCQHPVEKFCVHPTSLGVPDTPLLLPSHLSPFGPQGSTPCIPQSRTSACGGFIGRGLTDSRGSHPLGYPMFGLCLPSTCALIIADANPYVNRFLKNF